MLRAVNVTDVRRHQRNGHYLYRLVLSEEERSFVAWQRYKSIRTFSDTIRKEHKVELPALPHRLFVTPLVVEERKALLGKFFSIIAKHDGICTSQSFRALLEQPPTDEDIILATTVEFNVGNARSLADQFLARFFGSIKPVPGPVTSTGTTIEASDVFDQIRRDKSIITVEQMQKCLESLNDDADGLVDRADFLGFTQKLLIDPSGKPYALTEEKLDQLFQTFDMAGHDNIDAEEFRLNWNRWICPVQKSHRALIVVDVQNDFICGSLALKECPANDDGAKVVPVINNIRQSNQFDVVVFTLDSHPPSHCSFHSQLCHHPLAHDTSIKADDAKVFDVVKLLGPPEVDQKLWPDHCVHGSWGEQLHSDLIKLPEDLTVQKGTHPDIDSYSAFWDNAKLSATPLLRMLQERSIDTVFVCGLAYDVCVAATSLHAVESGFRTFVIEDACAGVTNQGMKDMTQAMISAGCHIIQSRDIAKHIHDADDSIQLVRVARETQERLSVLIRNNTFVHPSIDTIVHAPIQANS